jgi:hypothetical protein
LFSAHFHPAFSFRCLSVALLSSLIHCDKARLAAILEMDVFSNGVGFVSEGDGSGCFVHEDKDGDVSGGGGDGGDDGDGGDGIGNGDDEDDEDKDESEKKIDEDEDEDRVKSKLQNNSLKGKVDEKLKEEIRWVNEIILLSRAILIDEKWVLKEFVLKYPTTRNDMKKNTNMKENKKEKGRQNLQTHVWQPFNEEWKGWGEQFALLSLWGCEMGDDMSSFL